MAVGAAGDDINNFLFSIQFFENAWFGVFQKLAYWQMTATNGWHEITDMGDNA